MQANNERAVKGKLGEDFTADYLIKNGYDIITRNYRKLRGDRYSSVERRYTCFCGSKDEKE